MKLNVRLILISFVIVLITSLATTIIYYSLSGRLLYKYQSQSILNSTNDFIFVLKSSLQKTEEDFKKLSPRPGGINKIELAGTSIDFMFELENDSLINSTQFKVKDNSYLDISSRSFLQFFENNPNVILNYVQFDEGRAIFFGKIITPEFLERIADKIRAEVALVIDDAPVEVSNASKNQKDLSKIEKAVDDLKFKNNFDIYTAEYSNADFTASYYTPRQILTPGGKVNFLIFNSFEEGVDFRNTLRIVMYLVIVSGSFLSFIFILLATTKLRKQITFLNEAAIIAGRGNFDHTVTIVSKDEIGRLGMAFNKMLSELKRKEESEKEYTEFITLINQNPTLKEVSEAALSKIIKTTGLTFGVLYVVEGGKLNLIASFGINKNFVAPIQEADLYSNSIEKKEVIEFRFRENFPEVKTGLASIKIKYLLIYPIVYNKETIAVLELASEALPANNVKSYIENIHEQLAIGLTNSKSLQQLENLVRELKLLNENYQRQNKQIIEQNEELKQLHSQLREKADELNRQREKAVELTKVKSQFLASMSHELRTPLISILGLTELLLKDNSLNAKTEDRIRIVHRNGKKLLALITNILEFSKFEFDKIEVKKESFLLSDFVEEIIPNIKQLAGEKNLTLLFELPDDGDLLINTDKAKLEQIINNLLVNAIKFTERGSVKLAVKIKDEKSVEFSVSDTGIGIPEENKERIFSEFHQLDSSTTRKYGGAGLGLTICDRYITLLGGKISVESHVGKGSTFSFVLPDIILDTIESRPLNFMKEYDEQQEKTANVLLVGKIPGNKKLIGDYLSNYNYEISTADYENNLILLIEELSPEIIVLLLESSDAGIWKVISDIKKSQLAESAELVLVSINYLEKIAWLPNITGFISKPVDEVKLRKEIYKIISGFKNPVEKICFFTENEAELNYIAGLPGLPKIEKNPASRDVRELLSNEGNKIVLIDLETMYTKFLEIIPFLSNRKYSAFNHAVVCLPEIIPDEIAIELSRSLFELTLVQKQHPLDMLKELKDFLKIDESKLVNKTNLIEEVVITPVKKDTTTPASRQKILIVDDDNDSLFTIGEYIKELDYDTIFAHNGMECLLMLNHVKPDLILLDIMMPKMDGFETIKRIRAEEKYADIPVIALTAYAMLDNKFVIEKNGFNDLVTKPVDFTSLEIKIKSHL